MTKFIAHLLKSEDLVRADGHPGYDCACDQYVCSVCFITKAIRAVGRRAAAALSLRGGACKTIAVRKPQNNNSKIKFTIKTETVASGHTNKQQRTAIITVTNNGNNKNIVCVRV